LILSVEEIDSNGEIAAWFDSMRTGLDGEFDGSGVGRYETADQK
jgi:hypothetical protein